MTAGQHQSTAGAGDLSLSPRHSFDDKTAQLCDLKSSQRPLSVKPQSSNKTPATFTLIQKGTQQPQHRNFKIVCNPTNVNI